VTEGDIMWHRVAISAILMVSSAVALAANAHEHPLNAWNTFNKRTALQCPELKIGEKPAGDVNYLQEGFYDTLNAKQRRVFTNAIPRTNGGPRSCANRNGISCPTGWNMIAIEKARLLPRFINYACSQGAHIP
jgi:hypothetical protein